MNSKKFDSILVGTLLSLSSVLHAQTSVFSSPDPNTNRPPSGPAQPPPKLPEKAPAATPTPTAKKPNPAQQDASRQAVYTAFKQFEPELGYLIKHSDPYRRRPYSFRAKRYLDRCTQHVASFPNDESIVHSCLLNEALIYYHSGNMAKAIPSLFQVARRMSEDPSGQRAADLLLNLGQKSPQEVIPLVAELEKLPPYATPEWREKLSRFRLQGAAAEIAKERDPLKKAKAMEDIAKQYGQADEAAKLFLQAANFYMQAGQLFLATNAWQKVTEQFTQKPEGPIAMWNMAVHLENANELHKAAQAYHRYATTYTSQEKTDMALMRACNLYVALENDLANATCVSASAKYPKEVIGLFDRIIASRERDQKEEALSDLLESVYFTQLPTSPEQRIIALHRLYRLQKRLNRNTQETVRKIFALSGPAPAPAPLRKIVAEINFREVERAHLVFRDLKLLTDNVQSLSSSLQVKETALQQIAAAAQNVLSLNDPEWATACYWLIGQSYEQMVFTLQSSLRTVVGADKKASLQRAQQFAITAQQNYQLGIDFAKKNRVMSVYALRLREKDIRQRQPRYSFDDYLPIPDAVSVDMPINLIPMIRGR